MSEKTEAHEENPIVLSLARSGVRVRDISNNKGFEKKINENGNYDTEELLTMYDLLPKEMQKVAIEQMKSLLTYCERTAVR